MGPSEWLRLSSVLQPGSAIHTGRRLHPHGHIADAFFVLPHGYGVCVLRLWISVTVFFSFKSSIWCFLIFLFLCEDCIFSLEARSRLGAEALLSWRSTSIILASLPPQCWCLLTVFSASVEIFQRVSSEWHLGHSVILLGHRDPGSPVGRCSGSRSGPWQAGLGSSLSLYSCLGREPALYG